MYSVGDDKGKCQLFLGVVTLIKDYEVCRKGSVLTPEQAKILELLEYRLATFKLILRACWIKGKGFEMFAEEAEDEDEEEMEINDDEND